MSITVNKKAFHDYFVEEKFEAGIVLEGWEVKAIRAGRMNIKESYVIIKSGEIFLIGMHISPLAMASSHNKHDPIRTRKLLLNRREIDDGGLTFCGHLNQFKAWDKTLFSDKLGVEGQA